MKTKLFFAAFVGAAMNAFAQTPIVSFPADLGTVEYGKVSAIPDELKEANSMIYKAETDGYIIAQYYGAYGYNGVCSCDAEMQLFFPPKDWMKVANHFIGLNEAGQVIAVKDSKKGALIGVFDKHMNLQKSATIEEIPHYSDYYVADTYVADNKIYMLVWQENQKHNSWWGYILDANSLEILSKKAISTSKRTRFTFSENKEYIGCVAIDEKKGKYFYHPLYNGATIKLLDKNFTLIKERYVYGNIDDPWVWAQDEKTRKKIYNGGMTGILTNGDANIQVDNDGVLRYLTLDAASAHIITASSNTITPIRANRLMSYTLSANRNDSASVSDILSDKIFMKQTLIHADDNNAVLQAWYKTSQRQTSSVGYVVLNWNMNTNEWVTMTDEGKIFPAEGRDDFKEIIYQDDSCMLVEHIRGREKGSIYYYMWCSKDGKTISFPYFIAPSANDNYEVLNNVYYLSSIKIRDLVAYSKTTGVFCFLVHESLNSGYNAMAPDDVTKPLYLEFLNKDGVISEYVFPEMTYDVVSFGMLVGPAKSYKSLLNVNASQTKDGALRLYIRHTKDQTHQWVILRPSLFDSK
ncbi:MAG: hypothetical protein KBT27_15040 [Prevotellaceae bacterium]|nr:hypothetical protein [Candidatus Faecinaster equi]